MIQGDQTRDSIRRSLRSRIALWRLRLRIRRSMSIRIDATQWHSWAVEWSPQRIATFVDGAQWWETTNAAHLPTGLMRLCMQLDNFGGDISQGGQQIVDWARQYPLVKT